MLKNLVFKYLTLFTLILTVFISSTVYSVNLKIRNLFNKDIKVTYQYHKEPKASEEPLRYTVPLSHKRQIVLTDAEKLKDLSIDTGSYVRAIAAAAGIAEYDLIVKEIWPALRKFPEKNIILRISPSLIASYASQVTVDKKEDVTEQMPKLLAEAFPSLKAAFDQAERAGKEPIILPVHILGISISPVHGEVEEAYNRLTREMQDKQRTVSSSSDARYYAEALSLINAAHDALTKASPEYQRIFDEMAKDKILKQAELF